MTTRHPRRRWWRRGGDDEPRSPSTSVLPIGLAMGPGPSLAAGPDEAPDGGPRVPRVRLGAEVLEITTEQFALWELAHTPADDHNVPSAARDWDGLRAEALRREIAAPRTVKAAVETLRRQTLLEAVTPGTAEAREFAERYRLVPLALGLGSLSGDTFGVGLLAEPVARLTPTLADLWQFAPMADTLWGACRDAAAVADAAGIRDPHQTDPQRVLYHALDALPVLLSSRVACLDRPLATRVGSR